MKVGKVHEHVGLARLHFTTNVRYCGQCMGMHMLIC